MAAKSEKFNGFVFIIKPNQQKVSFNMALHTILIVAR